jgi:hypothetical protein
MFAGVFVFAAGRVWVFVSVFKLCLSFDLGFVPLTDTTNEALRSGHPPCSRRGHECFGFAFKALAMLIHK